MKTLKYISLCCVHTGNVKLRYQKIRYFCKENKIEFCFLFICRMILCGKDLYDVRNLDDLAVQFGEREIRSGNELPMAL